MTRLHPRLPIAMITVLAALQGPACVDADPAPSRSARPIVGGVDNTDDSAVVALLGQVGDNTYLCSGVLVAPRTVLTAAHCVYDRDSINVVFADDIHDADTIVAEIAAASWQAHPTYQATPTNMFDRHFDLGLVLLTADAPADPVLVNRIPLDATLVDEPLHLVGYGDTYNEAYDSGKRRDATTTLRSYDDWWTTAGAYDANTCVGDSGGPQLMQAGGAEVVVGVTSFGTAPAGEELCRFDSIAARVDIAAAEFIDAFITANDTPGACGEDGVCGATCPTPAQDPDCRDLCVEDGNCEPSCGDFDPDCLEEPTPDAGLPEQLDASGQTGDDPEGESGGGCSASLPSTHSGQVFWLFGLLSLLLVARRVRQ